MGSFGKTALEKGLLTMEFVAYKENLDSFFGRGRLPIGHSTMQYSVTRRVRIYYICAIKHIGSGLSLIASDRGNLGTVKPRVAPASIGVTGRSLNICKADGCGSRHRRDAAWIESPLSNLANSKPSIWPERDCMLRSRISRADSACTTEARLL